MVDRSKAAPLFFLLITVLFVLVIACGTIQRSEITGAIAVLQPVGGSTVSGEIRFIQEGTSVKIEGTVTGLTPGKHGFHIHQYGDCSAADGSSAGGHYNPTNQPHGGPADKLRHVGDLGNIVADNTGTATIDMMDDVITLNGPFSIIGRAVVVHAGADDLTSQPSGAAGPRAACGVIGIMKME